MKVALVTGGSRGIGAETVKAFAKANYTVILNYNRSQVQAEKLRDELVQDGCDVHLFCADVSDSAQVAEMFLFVKKYFKHLDVLVNNAGISRVALCQDMSEDDFDAVMNVNAKGTFLCCQQAAKMFVERSRGAIVNVASIWGLKGASCESAYAMSKFAVVGLTKSLAEELAPSNVTVNCVCPPIVHTDMTSHLSRQDIEDFCSRQNVSEYLPQQIARDILRLAEGKKTGVIFQEK